MQPGEGTPGGEIILFQRTIPGMHSRLLQAATLSQSKSPGLRPLNDELSPKYLRAPTRVGQ